MMLWRVGEEEGKGEEKGKGLRVFVDSADVYKIKFKWYYLPGLVIERAAMYWHYKNRSLPSQYPPKYNMKGLAYVSCLVLVVVCCYYYFS